MEQSIIENSQQKSWYDKYYKIMLLPPILLFIISIIYLVSFNSQNNDFIYKDPSLSGGTTITINSDIESSEIESALSPQFPDIRIRTINDVSTGRRIAIIIDSSASPEELIPAIEEILGYQLTNENSSIEFSGSSLGDNFYRQLIIAVII